MPSVPQLRKEIFDQAHRVKLTIHPSSMKMYRDLKGQFWWKCMKRDMAEYVARCYTCQQLKVGHQCPIGLLQPISVSEWIWDHITMDFLYGLHCTSKGHSDVWVVVDRLTKSAHFLGIKTTDSLGTLRCLYVVEIVRLHGVPLSIVLD